MLALWHRARAPPHTARPELATTDREHESFEPRALTRREAIALAAALGASLAWPRRAASASASQWRERRDLCPQGVASGDPYHDSVILWTRRAPAAVSEATDWTCRVLVAGPAPARVYWYRSTDEHGFGSRVGRTVTVPAPSDDRPVSFAFVSRQNVQDGACKACRRMI